MAYPKLEGGNNEPQEPPQSSDNTINRRAFLKKLAGLVGTAALAQVTGACDERGCSNAPARQNAEGCTPAPSSGIIKVEACRPAPEPCRKP